MKKLIIFYSIVMATALNADASSSSSNNKSKNKQSTQKKALTAILPESIKIPGKRGKAFEKVNLDAQDHISKMSFREHINEMHKEYNLPWIMAAFWWKQDDGSLARDYASAVEFNSWRLNDKHQVVNKLHPLHQRKIVCPEYYIFEIENKKLLVEYAGSEKLLSLHDSILIELFNIVTNPNSHGVAYFEKKMKTFVSTHSWLNHLGHLYCEKKNISQASRWWARGLKKGDAMSATSLAIHYLGNKDFDKALQLFKQVMNMQNDDKLTVNRITNNIAYTHECQGNIGEAIKWYLKAVQPRGWASHPARLNLFYLLATRPEAIKNTVSHDLLLTNAKWALENITSNSYEDIEYKENYSNRYEKAIEAINNLLNNSV